MVLWVGWNVLIDWCGKDGCGDGSLTTVAAGLVWVVVVVHALWLVEISRAAWEAWMLGAVHMEYMAQLMDWQVLGRDAPEGRAAVWCAGIARGAGRIGRAWRGSLLRLSRSMCCWCLGGAPVAWCPHCVVADTG